MGKGIRSRSTQLSPPSTSLAPWGTARPGAASIPPWLLLQLLGSRAQSPTGIIWHPPPRHPARAAGPTPQGASRLPRPPLPACTVRRRRRRTAAVAQPQRRVATGRVPVSLAMASSSSAGCRLGTGARCPPGAYVGHEPSQPAPSTPPHRLVETGTGCCQGNGFQPPSIRPRPWTPALHPRLA